MIIIMATFTWNMNKSQFFPLWWFAGCFHDQVCVSVYVRFMIMCLWDGCLSSERRQCEQSEKHNLKSFPLSFRGPGRFGCQATLGKSFQLIHFELDGLYCRRGPNHPDSPRRYCRMYEGYTKTGCSSNKLCTEVVGDLLEKQDDFELWYLVPIEKIVRH